MADDDDDVDDHDMHTGICSSGGGGGSWWNNPYTSASGFDEPSPSVTDVLSRGNLSWTTTNEEPAGSAPASSSVTFKEVNKAQLISSFDLSSSTLDWTPSLFRSTGERSQSSFQGMLHDQVHIGLDRSTSNPFKEMYQNFALDHQQQHLISSENTETAGDLSTVSRFPVVLSSFGCSPPKLQSLLGPVMKLQPYDDRVIDYRFPATAYQESSSSLLQPSSWGKFSDLLRASPPKQTSSNQLQLSNVDVPFWNASAGASISDSQLHTEEIFESKTVQINLSAKESFRDSCSSSSSSKRTSTRESAMKKPRMETSSSLPTFKVRKEKLGDRITALQQLVSPFGKTDTASVLHEAIEYIKFLHDQVDVLSTPYLKKGPPIHHQKGSDKWKEGEGANQNLRSRGLCLVPIASTYPLASETNAEDLWPPTFGRPLR